MTEKDAGGLITNACTCTTSAKRISADRLRSDSIIGNSDGVVVAEVLLVTNYYSQDTVIAIVCESKIK